MSAMLARTPDLDFLYYSNDMIGMGGLLYCQDAGIDVPGQIGMAGFNDLELLDGLPTRLATMDSMRIEIGRAAAKIIVSGSKTDGEDSERIEMTPMLQPGGTLRPV